MKKYVSEFVGTLVLVLFGCGVAAVTGCVVPEAGYAATALAFSPADNLNTAMVDCDSITSRI